MQQEIHGDHPKNASITLLPIIDLNPTNYTCIYSTLLFVIDQCRRLNIPTPSITLGQSLWLKSTAISVEKLLNIVIHLGGFHTLMSFVDSIGSLMDGSGIESILQTSYGENTIKHILRGKATLRAVRAHTLIESALTILFQQMLLSDETKCTAIERFREEDIKQIEAACNISELPDKKDYLPKFLKCVIVGDSAG